MSTVYNVTEDRRDWARVKASLLSPVDRACMLEELIRRDEKAAARIIGALASEQHGLRAKARRA
jgi:hypothetical protein